MSEGFNKQYRGPTTDPAAATLLSFKLSTDLANNPDNEKMESSNSQTYSNVRNANLDADGFIKKVNENKFVYPGIALVFATLLTVITAMQPLTPMTYKIISGILLAVFAIITIILVWKK